MSSSDSISLAYIIQNRRKLLVRPLRWTWRQLDAVRCSFQRIITPGDDDLSDAELRKQEAELKETVGRTVKGRDVESARSLLVNTTLNMKLKMVRRILLGHEEMFDAFRPGGSFYFAGRRVPTMPYTVFYRTNKAARAIKNSLPSVGFVLYSRISTHRAALFKLGPGFKDRSAAAKKASKKKLKQFRPKKWKKDPYIVCLLLAIVQRQDRYATRRNFVQKTFWPQLLVSNNWDPCFIYLYEGQITREFLEMLRKTTPVISASNAPIIRWKKIRIRPFENFKARLIALLSAGVASVRVDLRIPKTVPTVHLKDKFPPDYCGRKREREEKMDYYPRSVKRRMRPEPSFGKGE